MLHFLPTVTQQLNLWGFPSQTPVLETLFPITGFGKSILKTLISAYSVLRKYSLFLYAYVVWIDSKDFVAMQILLKDGTCVYLRSWNARRFHGQMLSVKRNIVSKIVAGPPNILHMSAKSTFWLVGLIRFLTCPFFSLCL